MSIKKPNENVIIVKKIMLNFEQPDFDPKCAAKCSKM